MCKSPGAGGAGATNTTRAPRGQPLHLLVHRGEQRLPVRGAAPGEPLARFSSIRRVQPAQPHHDVGINVRDDIVQVRGHRLQTLLRPPERMAFVVQPKPPATPQPGKARLATSTPYVPETSSNPDAKDAATESPITATWRIYTRKPAPSTRPGAVPSPGVSLRRRASSSMTRPVAREHRTHMGAGTTTTATPRSTRSQHRKHRAHGEGSSAAGEPAFRRSGTRRPSPP